MTLYDAENDTVIGKAEISGSSVDIPITCSPASIGDSITLTVVSHNYIPSIEKIAVSEETDISAIGNFKNMLGIVLKGNNLVVKLPTNSNATFSIFDLKGRSLYKWNNSNNGNSKEEITINLLETNISNGLYLIKGNIGNHTIEKRFNFVK